MDCKLVNDQLEIQPVYILTPLKKYFSFLFISIFARYFLVRSIGKTFSPCINSKSAYLTCRHNFPMFPPSFALLHSSVYYFGIVCPFSLEFIFRSVLMYISMFMAHQTSMSHLEPSKLGSSSIMPWSTLLTKTFNKLCFKVSFFFSTIGFHH